jgi:hypothetical protein
MHPEQNQYGCTNSVICTLKATESRFLSSLESSTPVSVTAFMEAAMSSYLQQDCTNYRDNFGLRLA